ncbi:MAG TPA: HPr(Ser) kinase/phosphatase [Proteobacteria bacterium]|nr:HPr kinase/phosphorylase [bacterium BMS3Abin14]HDL54224.1 HPr(Ser) kinase/phosphatase [Pseudomonadota bacterium]
MISIPVGTFFEHNREELDLEVLAGWDGVERPIRIARIQKPGLALAGYLDQIHRDRVQILGKTEISYLAALETKVAWQRLNGLCSSGVSCLIVAKGLDVPDAMRELADRHKVPLLRSPEISSNLIRRVTNYLEDILAPETSVHGAMIDVFGVGILLLGKSGIGKSECALGLVERGHRLVGDDVVIIKRKVAGILSGSCDELIEHHIEIRGLGIINIKDLYGVSSIRKTKKLELIVELIEWLQGEEIERTGLDERTYSILDSSVPYLRIPVRPARDLSLIVEVAARNHLLKGMGYDAAQEFDINLSRKINSNRVKRKKPDLGSVE